MTTRWRAIFVMSGLGAAVVAAVFLLTRADARREIGLDVAFDDAFDLGPHGPERNRDVYGYGTTDERWRGSFGKLHEAKLVAAEPRALVDPNRNNANISASADPGKLPCIFFPCMMNAIDRSFVLAKGRPAPAPIRCA